MRYLFVAFILFLTTSSVHADSSDCPLTGIKSITVQMDLSYSDKGINLDSNIIKSKIESRLKECGIAVSSGGPKLKIIVSTTGFLQNAGYAVSVRSELEESVALPRTGSNPVIVTTWKDAFTGVVKNTDAVNSIQSVIDDVTDDFIADFQKDNPKPNGASVVSQ